MKKENFEMPYGFIIPHFAKENRTAGNLLHPQSVQLFLFFDFPAQLAVDGRTLPILFLEPIFKTFW